VETVEGDAMIKLAALEQVIRIFRTYVPEGDLFINYDTKRLHVRGVEPDVVMKADLQALENLGWHWSTTELCWHYHYE
jgi:hypothetical protein